MLWWLVTAQWLWLPAEVVTRIRLYVIALLQIRFAVAYDRLAGYALCDIAQLALHAKSFITESRAGRIPFPPVTRPKCVHVSYRLGHVAEIVVVTGTGHYHVMVNSYGLVLWRAGSITTALGTLARLPHQIHTGEIVLPVCSTPILMIKHGDADCLKTLFHQFLGEQVTDLIS